MRRRSSMLTKILSLLVPVALAMSVPSVSFAQEENAPKPRKTKKVQSVTQKNAKVFTKIAEAQEAENFAEMTRLINKLSSEEKLNNIERAYIYQFKGNICFTQDNLNCALSEFKKVLGITEGIPDAMYNNVIYVVAQVLFSQEKYREALNYAKRYLRTQELPSPDVLILVGQAHYVLKEYDQALPNVQKAITMYEELGTRPKENWLNLLSSIYRQKGQYRKMLPVVKQLVEYYPRKRYLTTLGGVYNELDDQRRMTAIYQALYDQNLMTKESELVTLASLALSQDNPYRASQILQKGMDQGIVKKNLKNLRILSQALYASREYEDALAPLRSAAGLSKDGKLFNQLGQSLIALNRWKEAEGAMKNAIKKGKLRDTGQSLISLGLTQFEQKKFKSAEDTFKRALRYEKVNKTAANWIKYVKAEVVRIRELEAPIPEIDTSVEPIT